MKTNKIIMGLVIVSVVIGGVSVESYAFEGRRSNRFMRHHPHYGKVVLFKEDPVKVIIGSHEYFFADGTFYQRYGSHYVVIGAPIGAVIRRLPKKATQLIVGGTTYSYYNDVYYVRYLDGYQVVQDPVYGVAALPKNVTIVHEPATTTPVVLSPQVAATTQDAFVVNIPNMTGSYVPVTIKRSGNGFVGPQGEFYADFSKVFAHLAASINGWL